MAVFKLTMVFNHQSAISSPGAPVHRTGGFSESYYKVGNTISDVINDATLEPGQGGSGLFSRRANLLGLGSAIVGFRIQQVSPLGPAQSGAVSYPGVPTRATDVPQMALLVKAPAVGANNIRRWKLKGVPDDMVKEGEFSPDSGYQIAVSSFLVALNTWNFRARDLTQTTVKIVNIAVVAGVTTVNTEVPPTVLVNDFVRILRTLDANKVQRGGRFQVLTVGPGNAFTIGLWPFGSTTGGSARKDGIVFPLFNGSIAAVSRSVVAKVGRAPFQYRGRRTKRR